MSVVCCHSPLYVALHFSFVDIFLWLFVQEILQNQMRVILISFFLLILKCKLNQEINMFSLMYVCLTKFASFLLDCKRFCQRNFSNKIFWLPGLKVKFWKNTKIFIRKKLFGGNERRFSSWGTKILSSVKFSVRKFLSNKKCQKKCSWRNVLTLILVDRHYSKRMIHTKVIPDTSNSSQK